MYLCRECGAEFIDPLGGRCPACGVRVKPSWETERMGEPVPPPGTGEVESTVEFSLEAEEAPEAMPTATITPSRRPSEPQSPVDSFPDRGVYGPPRDYGGPASPAPAAPRRTGTGALVPVVIILGLFGVIAAVVLLLAGPCFVETLVEGITETVETMKPLWQDRAAEMREAGYAPVAGLPPDLWPAAEMTLWLVADDQAIFYQAVKDDVLQSLPLPDGTRLIGDLSPTPDGTGIVAVLALGDGLGVYRLAVDGAWERLLDGEALFKELSKAHGGEEGYVRDLSRARSSGELLAQPRLEESGRTLFVAAGPPGRYELWRAELSTGVVEPIQTHNRNAIPCLVRDGTLYYQHHSTGPGEPALVYARSLDTGEHAFIMTPGNDGGLISFDLASDGSFAYLGRDYRGAAVVFYQRPGGSAGEHFSVPGETPESVELGPGGVVVVVGAYEGRDNVVFFNLDNLDGPDMPYIRYWTGISDIRSARLGPPLAAF